jgi:hypothetical protein
VSRWTDAVFGPTAVKGELEDEVQQLAAAEDDRQQCSVGDLSATVENDADDRGDQHGDGGAAEVRNRAEDVLTGCAAVLREPAGE